MTAKLDQLPAHSKLGASSAERWMNCPGSVALLKRLDLPPSDEPEYRSRGVAAHALLADCLEAQKDAWEQIGAKYDQVVIDDEIERAVQEAIDFIRPRMEGYTGGWGVEEKVHRPELHPDMFGTIDVWGYCDEEATLDIIDYKNGAGVVVDVEWNVQLLYYAKMKLDQFPACRTVVLTIIQPNAFHPAGTIRSWDISAEAVHEWAENELIPHMNRVEMDGKLDAGEWCRFCPAKLICPLLVSLFGAAAKADIKEVKYISNESLGRSYQYVQAVEMYIKAMKDEVLRLNMRGKLVAGTKLVAKRANRVFKAGAEEKLVAALGENAYTKPALKSPPQIELLGHEAKLLVAEWAYTPQTGLTVARENDKRPAVKIASATEAWEGTEVDDGEA